MRGYVPIVEFINVLNSVVFEKTTLLYALYIYVFPFCRKNRSRSFSSRHAAYRCSLRRRAERRALRVTGSESSILISYRVLSFGDVWLAQFIIRQLAPKGGFLLETVLRFLLAPLPKFVPSFRFLYGTVCDAVYFRLYTFTAFIPTIRGTCFIYTHTFVIYIRIYHTSTRRIL